MGDAESVRGATGWEFLTPALSAALSEQARTEVRRRRRDHLDSDELVNACWVRLRELAEAGCLAGDLAAQSDHALRLLVRGVASELARPLERERRARAARGGGLWREDRVESAEEPGRWDKVGGPTAGSARGARTLVSEDGASAAAALECMLASLRPPATPEQKEALALRLQGMTFREIGRQLARDASSVRERLCRLLARLRGDWTPPSGRLSLPDVSSTFLAGVSPRWRRVYHAWRGGFTRKAIARREGLSDASVAAIVRRLARAILRAQT